MFGAPPKNSDIFFGSAPRCTLAVTQNLAQALPYPRYPDGRRILWIDAICVNQTDLRERSQQVKLMANIFSMPRRVVVRLREEGNHSTLPFQALKGFHTKAEMSWSTNTMKQASGDASGDTWADTHTQPQFRDLEWSSINDLIHRPWFERLWTWQEISWKAFRSGVYCLQKPFPFGPNDFYSRTTHIYKLCDSQTHSRKYPFRLLVGMTRHCECSDPRDRVYALQSITTLKR
jgi:hypothetical protein